MPNNPFQDTWKQANAPTRAAKEDRWQQQARRDTQVKTSVSLNNTYEEEEVLSVQVRIPKALGSITDTRANAVSRGTDTIKKVCKHMDFVEAFPHFVEKLEQISKGPGKATIKLGGRQLLLAHEDLDTLLAIFRRAEILCDEKSDGGPRISPLPPKEFSSTGTLSQEMYVDIKMAQLMGMSVQDFRKHRDRGPVYREEDDEPEK